MMKQIALAAIMTLALSIPVQATTPATSASNLYGRCAKSMSVCATAVHWVQFNTASCTPAGMQEPAITKSVYAWLKKNPKKTGQNDNELVSLAIGALWPCR